MTRKTESALQLKTAILRREILQMIVKARGTHIGSAFSIIDIITYLFARVLRFNPKKPDDPRRDIFVLSKGHGCAALYVVLADYGFFPKNELAGYCSEGGILGGHPDHTRVPGVETSTGSLGHGFPVAVGFALAAKINKSRRHVYCIVGDGECNEGSIWEAVQVAAHHTLDNLTLIVDDNKIMIGGFTKDILNPFSYKEKFTAFGWNAIEMDGHDFADMERVFPLALGHKGKPTVIIADTVKGKGVSFMENDKQWHSALPDDQQLAAALSELEALVKRAKQV